METGAFTLVEDSENQAKWLHHGKEIKDTFIAFNAKFLGSVEVSQPKGVDMVKDSIKKLKIARQLKKADAGHKASKLVKVEIIISIDCIKVVEVKNKNMICARPLQRVSYCADDHRDKRLFAFIAKEQETKSHKCFVFVSEKEASEITLTLGQAFQLAYKRYLEKEKTEKKDSATESAINIEKENTLLKEENVRLKQALETNKTKETVNNTPVEPPTTPMKPTLSSASFGFITDTAQSPIDMNDISFTPGGFNKSDNDFDPRNTNNHFNEANTNMLNVFAENNTNKMFTLGTPSEEDFIVKQDPFADTPDWSSAASICSEGVTRQQSAPGQLFNGTIPNNVVNGHCGNPFANSIGTTDINKQDLNTSFSDPNCDLFTQYLSNVVAQRTNSDASLNGISSSNESFFTESNNSSTNNIDHFNLDHQFSVNNEFAFDKLNLTDASGNTINEFNETDDGFFTDGNFVQRPKAHTITVLTADEQKFHNFNPSTSSIDNVNKSILTTGEGNVTSPDTGSNEVGFFSDETFERPKAKSVGASYNQVVRPRPTSLALQGQVLPAPPSKQSIKKPSSLLIKSPSQKMVTSTPLKEEPVKEVVMEEKQNQKPRSASYILPNVRSAAPPTETRARSRSRHIPLQPAAPLKESISRASKSLEDLCSIDSPTSSKSMSPKSTPGSRVPTNPFTATTPQF